MYKVPQFHETKLNIYDTVEGETIEHKIERIVNNKEPIKDGAPLIYTDRKEGIKKAYDIRTDRWEVAIEATDKIAKSYEARRDNVGGKVIDLNKDTEGEPIQGEQ